MSAEIAGRPGTAPRVRPASPNKPAMPTKQCVRADEERLLVARSPQKSTGRSEEDTIGVLQTRAGDLSAKNRKLMSEHDDLELLELTRTQTQRRYREDAPKQQIHQRHEQGQTPSSRMRTARLYGREVTSDAPSSNQTDSRTPQASRTLPCLGLGRCRPHRRATAAL
jgi:hypothetical protein